MRGSGSWHARAQATGEGRRDTLVGRDNRRRRDRRDRRRRDTRDTVEGIGVLPSIIIYCDDHNTITVFIIVVLDPIAVVVLE